MRGYLRDFAIVSRQLGALLGTFLIFLSFPGFLILLRSNDILAPHISGAWRIGIAVVSGLFCAIGVYLLFASLRLWLYFSLRDRVQLPSRSKRRASE
jgi:hypothetical protein